MLNLQKYGDLISAKEPTVSLIPGKCLNISGHVYIDPKDDNTEITEAVQQLSLMSPDWLKAELESSARLEEIIASDIEESFNRWIGQAKVSRLLQNAIEVVETGMPEHSGNKWEIQARSSRTTHTISNAVYQMTIDIEEGRKYNRNSGIAVPKWSLSWNIVLNTPPSARRITCYGIEYVIVAGHTKTFTNKERAEKYFEAVKAQYAHYFKEDVPPVPREYAKHFTISGVLIPGYSLEPEQEADPDTSSGAA